MVGTRARSGLSGRSGRDEQGQAEWTCPELRSNRSYGSNVVPVLRRLRRFVAGRTGLGVLGVRLVVGLVEPVGRIGGRSDGESRHEGACRMTSADDRRDSRARCPCHDGG